MNPIVIKTYPVKEGKNELIRLQKSAQEIVRRYQRESGLSASFIVSELIRQTEGCIEFGENSHVHLS